MTIPESTGKSGPYVTNGVQTQFDRTFFAYDAADVEVIYTDADGVATVVTSGITHTNLGLLTGKVTLSPAPADGGTITLRLNPPVKQSTEFRSQGGYSPDVVELAVDKVVLMLQALQEQLSRVISVPVDSDVTPDNYLSTIEGYVAGAAASEVAAAASELAAAGSEDNAADSETAAASHAIAAQAASNTAASILAQGIYTDVITLTVADSPFTPLVAADGVCYALDMSGGAITVNLSELSTYGQNMRFGFVKVDGSGNTATINRGGSTDTINGSASATVTTQHTVNSLFGVESAGTWVLAAQTTAIPDGSIANAKLANMAQATIKGRAAGAGTGVPVDLTATQARAILDVYTKAEVDGVVGSGAAPTMQILKSGTTYTTPAGCVEIMVEEVGGGGGGGGNNAGGSAGGDTSFNSIVAKGGGGGQNGVQTIGGAGGTGGTGTALLRIAGNGGGIGVEGNSSAYGRGGHGCASFFGGGTPGQGQNSATAAAANTGAGGAGSQSGTLAIGAPGSSGGGAGEYVMFIISSPAATYTYAIGAGGAGGSLSGGAGGSGLIRVTEYY